MTNFRTPDGTRLAYHVVGEGTPLICVPGGPMHASAYLGDLGGLGSANRLPRTPDGSPGDSNQSVGASQRRLVLLDLRGTGDSELPADLATCRADRLAEDVDALRSHLGLDRVDLLAHSAGANVAVRYAQAHPDRIARLVLVTPSVFAVGIEIPPQARREMIELRTGAPWFESASSAFDRIASGNATPDDWDAIVPCYYGRWDDAAKEHWARQQASENPALAEAFRAEGAFDPPATRAALARLPAPVLIVAGELDIAGPPRILAEYPALFPNARLVVQPNTAHSPWLDDPKAFTTTVEAFLSA